MALVKWTDDLSVGVDNLDNQHRQLIDLINSLNDAMASGKGKDAIGETLSGLADYTITHFATEEKMFDTYSYSLAVAHRHEHQNFVKKVQEFKDGLDSGKMLLTMEVMNFLKDWLVKHIQDSDKKYKQFFNQKGVK